MSRFLLSKYFPLQDKHLRHKVVLVFLMLIMVLGFSCKKKPQLPPYLPALSFFTWGKGVEEALTSLQKSGWDVQSANKEQVRLAITPKIEDVPKIKGITDRSAPNLAEIIFYLQKSKLMLARIRLWDAKKTIEASYTKLKDKYKLPLASWSSKDRTKKDSMGNSFTERLSLYEKEDMFVVVHHSFSELAEDRLSDGRNANLEIVLYSKLNPGLTRASLLETLRK